MRKILIILLFFVAKAQGSTFANFELIEDKVIVSLSVIHEAIQLSQKHGYKFCEILSYSIDYNGHNHSFQGKESEDSPSGEKFSIRLGNNHLTIKSFYIPSDHPKVMDTYVYSRFLEELEHKMQTKLIRHDLL